MGTIWTPSGEHRPRDEEPARPAGAPGGGFADAAPPSVVDEISPEELEAVRQLHDQLRATPAADIVANHVIQLFQLAGVYLGLGTPPDELGRIPAPDLAQAGFVIDSMAALIDGMGERFGEHEQTMRDALAQLQMAFVQIADAAED